MGNIWTYAGWWFVTCFIFHILGISSSQLTNSIIFQRGDITNQKLPSGNFSHSYWKLPWKSGFTWISPLIILITVIYQSIYKLYINYINTSILMPMFLKTQRWAEDTSHWPIFQAGAGNLSEMIRVACPWSKKTQCAPGDAVGEFDSRGNWHSYGKIHHFKNGNPSINGPSIPWLG